MPRPPTAEDVARLRIPTGVRLSPDGTRVAFVVQQATKIHDAYRHAVWMAPFDGSAPAHQVTLGATHDSHPRFSPDGTTLAFLSDRRLLVENDPGAPKVREDGTQVFLLPLDGGEARRLTDCPRGVDMFAWSPDGRYMALLTSSEGATREEDARRRGRETVQAPDAPRHSDYRYIDRLNYQYNGRGFIYDRVPHLWLIEVESGQIRRLTSGPTAEASPAWSPDSTRIAYVTNRRRDHDLASRSDIYVIDVKSGREARLTGGDDAIFSAPAWLPDGQAVAALGGRYPSVFYGNDIWLVAADGSDAHPDGGRNLTAGSDLMPGSMMNSDVTVADEARIVPSTDGRWLTFAAPVDGSYALWRVSRNGGTPERVTTGREYVSGFDQGRSQAGGRIALIRSAPTAPPDVYVMDAPGTGTRAVGRRATRRPRRLTALNREVLAGVTLIEPRARRVTVDGRTIQGWLIPARAGRRPLVTEIHGGPHTLYGWSPSWEFQVLAGAGMSVFYCNPRGSEGYGRAFNEANRRDWGPGPMRDVLAGVDALVADGLANPKRLGVTGGSYGGYLTNWIVAHDKRFRAAITCRSVSDMTTLFLTGDISGGEWAEVEFGALPWNDPDYFRSISPLTYAARVRTPLLIQHSENDLRTTMAQAEALFVVLRSKRRPVRLMRVPDETHELTRSGTPFRRVENLVQVRDWFVHFLLEGGRRLPALPNVRAGK